MEAYWKVSLSDGSTFYSDDQNAGTGWFALKDHVKEDKLQIEKIEIVFEDHTQMVAGRSPAYFFSRGLDAIMLEDSIESYLFGTLNEDGKTFCVIKWILPHIIPVSVEDRLVDPTDERIIFCGSREK